jgi:hypothetical protein
MGKDKNKAREQSNARFNKKQERQKRVKARRQKVNDQIELSEKIRKALEEKENNE